MRPFSKHFGASGRIVVLRYFGIAAFMAMVAAVSLAVEGLLHVGGSKYSLTDSRGPGQIALFAILLPALLLFTRYATRVDVWQFVARYMSNWRRALKGMLVMACVTFVACVLAYILLAALGSVRLAPGALQEIGGDLAKQIAVGLLVVLLLAIVEEVIFRSFVLRYLRYDDTAWVTAGAVIVSSAIFAVSHLIALTNVWDLISKGPLLIGVFTIGVLLGTTYVATGSLACAIGVHWGLLSFKVVLIRTHFVQTVPGWTGGEYGDVRLAPTTWLAFLLATLALIVWRRRLQAAFGIETAVCPDDGGEFRRGSPSPASGATGQ